jgi:hypothetical protein
MRRLGILVISFLLVTPISEAECRGSTCIDVSADQEGKEVVITVKKGKAGSTSTSPPRARTTSSTRKPWIPWLPKPAVTRAAAPRPKVTSKPRIRTISGSQISDQVRSLLPTGTIITQPLKDPLIHEPVNFMTTVPTNFSTVIVVLRIPIAIHLTALYVWDFGDGNTLVTKFPGAPYPAMLNQHTYRSAGEKRASLTVRWSGFWSAGAMSAPINGSITQRIEKELTIRPARTTFIS